MTRTTNISTATVAGLVGYYFQRLKAPNTWPEPRFIYMEAIAGLSMLSAIIWLPFSWARISYPLEICLLFAWVATLGLLMDYTGPLNCGSIWDWGQITTGNTCSQWKAAIAFSLLSAVCWLFTAIMVRSSPTSLCVRLMIIGCDPHTPTRELEGLVAASETVKIRTPFSVSFRTAV